MTDLFESIPHMHDGLTKKERAILYCLHQTQKELGHRNVPTATLYGRVVELVDISEGEFQVILNNMAGRKGSTSAWLNTNGPHSL